jgi:beta-lactamase regulating signal transducer with metallopeptidase domain
MWFADYYLLSAVLLLLAAIATRLTRQAVHRLAIVKSTFLSLALLAGLCALPSWSIIHLLTARSAAATALPVESPSNQIDSKQQLLLTGGESTAAQPGEALQFQPASVQQPVATWNLSWPATLAAAQLAGSLLFVTWLGIGLVAAASLRFSSTQAPPELQNLLARQLTTTRTIELLVSPHIEVPVAMGIFRPAILLPLPRRERPGEGSPSLLEPSSPLLTSHTDLAPILAHELAHIQNHDLLWLAAVRALTVLLWSQPLFWFARRRMRLDQESLADVAAADITGRHQYAEQLVNWARNLHHRPALRAATAVGLWESPSQLRRRVALLLDDRFVIIRHFSHKLQFAAISLCAVIAVVLSLITLQPAQSSQQTAVSPPGDSAPISQVAVQPDHISIDDRFVLCQVTTDLQRSLLGDVDAPKSNASLVVFANYSAYRNNDISPDSPFFAGLSAQLRELANCDNRYAIFNVQVGQIKSESFEVTRQRSESIAKLGKQVAEDAGFKRGSWSVTYGGLVNWSADLANLEALAKLAGSQAEDSVGNDRISVFPVRTFLSRVLAQNADCVVNIQPIWQKEDGSSFVENLAPTMKRFIPSLSYSRRELLLVRHHDAMDAQSVVDDWSNDIARRDKLGQEFGFSVCQDQRTAVGEEDAKRDLNSRHSDSSDENKNADRTPLILSYGDGKPDGKKSYGGSGFMIEFEMPEGVTKVKGIRIHGSRYGLAQAPNEDFEIKFLSEGRDEVLHTETAPYKLFARGKTQTWVRIPFKDEVEVPKKFWIALNFNAEQTKGVYVSYDTSTKGEHSRVGLAGDDTDPKPTDFAGDWMIQVLLADPAKSK